MFPIKFFDSDNQLQTLGNDTVEETLPILSGRAGVQIFQFVYDHPVKDEILKGFSVPYTKEARASAAKALGFRIKDISNGSFEIYWGQQSPEPKLLNGMVFIGSRILPDTVGSKIRRFCKKQVFSATHINIEHQWGSVSSLAYNVPKLSVSCKTSATSDVKEYRFNPFQIWDDDTEDPLTACGSLSEVGSMIDMLESIEQKVCQDIDFAFDAMQVAL